MFSSTIISGVPCFHWEPDGGQEAGSSRTNFGDGIGPLLVEAFLRRTDIRVDREIRRDRRLLSVGSVLHLAEHGDVVWGSGVNGKIADLDLPAALDVRAVRGPLTRAALLSRGIAVPAVFGDPALLLPRLLPDIRRTDGTETVVIPNLNDVASFSRDEVDSPLGDPIDIIERIASARFVVASSLHALIVADAYGVPSRPLISATESPFKYVDYYAGTGRPNVSFATSVEEALALGPVGDPDVDLDALERAFPWDLWGRPAIRPAVELPLSYAGLRAAANSQRDSFVRAMGAEPARETVRAAVELDRFMAVPPPTSGITREEADALGVTLPHRAGREPDAAPVLSVVMPTHNVAPWVRETLESVLAQGVDRMEVIVVDDHSTDGTREIVHRYATADTRVTLVDAISRGGGTARNLGLDHASGRYVVFCDGDDIVPDGAYAALVASLQESGSDIAFGDYLKFRPMDTWRPTDSMPAFGHHRSAATLSEEPTLMYSRPCWNKAFDRDWWESRHIRFPDVPRSNDIVPMMRAYLLARKVDIVPDVVYLYRERPGGTSMTAKADSATSVLSYLAQEHECAKLVVSAHSRPIDKVYASLVYDRDGYIHIAKYVATWDGPRADDAAVSAAVAGLLDATPRPPKHISPLKRLVVELVARGEMAAARTMSEAIDHVAEVDADRALEGWAHALERIRAHELLRPGTELAFLAPLTTVLTARANPSSARHWRALVETVREVFGERFLMLVPEARLEGVRDDQILATRAELGGMVTEVTGGDRELVLVGRSDAGADAVAPVLHDGEFAGLAPVRPASIRWSRDADGSWRWRATFPVTSLPLHRPLTPALLVHATGSASAIRGEGELPAYGARDSFLYDRVDGVTVIRRRRHWAPRAARRGIILARDRVRSLKRR
ncbi:glycosyltransferase [Microbacterium sp. NPDC055683]